MRSGTRSFAAGTGNAAHRRNDRANSLSYRTSHGEDPPMRDAEIEAWSRWASPPVVAQVRADGLRAYDRCVLQGHPETEALAAGQATLELAIICYVWPQPLDPVLRPLRWAG
jgi:hypothetical protein